jgi:hypothetical protein
MNAVNVALDALGYTRKSKKNEAVEQTEAAADLPHLTVWMCKQQP